MAASATIHVLPALKCLADDVFEGLIIHSQCDASAALDSEVQTRTFVNQFPPLADTTLGVTGARFVARLPAGGASWIFAGRLSTECRGQL